MWLRWLLLAAGIGSSIVVILFVAHLGQRNTLSRYKWDVQSIGVRPADQAPIMSIALETLTTGYYVGEYIGICRVIDEISNLLPGEVSAIVCSWIDDVVEI